MSFLAWQEPTYLPINGGSHANGGDATNSAQFAAVYTRCNSCRATATHVHIFLSSSTIALGIRRRRRRSQRENASARSSSVLRRAISDARSFVAAAGLRAKGNEA
jgi:hypothetical protein